MRKLRGVILRFCRTIYLYPTSRI